MENFSILLHDQKRLNALAPPLKFIGYNGRDESASAWVRDTVNIGIVLSASFREASYEIDGRRVSAPIPACAFIRPGPLFRQSNPGPCAKLVLIYDRKHLSAFRAFLNGGPDAWMKPFPPNHPRILELLESIDKTAKSFFVRGNAERLDMIAAELLNEISLLNRFRREDTDPDVETVRLIASGIAARPDLPHDADKLAREHGLSSRTFRRIWMKQFRIPPGVFLAEKRLAEAKRLLKETNLRIYEIAERVGIGDPFYFSRFFRKKTGVSPEKYKKNDFL